MSLKLEYCNWHFGDLPHQLYVWEDKWALRRYWFTPAMEQWTRQHTPGARYSHSDGVLRFALKEHAMHFKLQWGR